MVVLWCVTSAVTTTTTNYRHTNRTAANLCTPCNTAPDPASERGYFTPAARTEGHGREGHQLQSPSIMNKAVRTSIISNTGALMTFPPHYTADFSTPRFLPGIIATSATRSVTFVIILKFYCNIKGSVNKFQWF